MFALFKCQGKVWFYVSVEQITLSEGKYETHDFY